VIPNAKKESFKFAIEANVSPNARIATHDFATYAAVITPLKAGIPVSNTSSFEIQIQVPVVVGTFGSDDSDGSGTCSIVALR
jgi:hypothetical protein